MAINITNSSGPARAADLLQVAEVVNQHQLWLGGGPTGHKTASGIVLDQPDLSPVRILSGLGAIATTGPAGTEADLTGGAYWVRPWVNELAVANAGRSGALDLASDVQPHTIVGHYIADVVQEVRSLVEGTAVRIIPISIDVGQYHCQTRYLIEPVATIASPVVLGAAIEGSETADTNEWARGDGPVSCWVTSRVVYNHAGDQILYAFVRKFTYNSLGGLESISAETRVTIDVTTACAEEAAS